jgi:hypothetical protein
MTVLAMPRWSLISAVFFKVAAALAVAAVV